MFQASWKWILIGTLLLGAAPARAETVDELLKQGIRLYAMADFDGSIKVLREVYSKTRSPKTLGKILLYLGCNYAEKGETANARRAFKGALNHFPSLTVDPRGLKPAIVTLFRQVRRSMKGSISVQSIQQVKVENLVPQDVLNEDVLRKRRRKTIWAYTALGVGAAAAVTMAVLYGVGKSQGDDAYDSYNKASDPSDIARYHEELDDAEATMTVGHGFLALTVVAFGFSVYQFLTRPEIPAALESREARNSSGFRLVPTIGGAGFSVGGRF